MWPFLFSQSMKTDEWYFELTFVHFVSADYIMLTWRLKILINTDVFLDISCIFIGLLFYWLLFFFLWLWGFLLALLIKWLICISFRLSQWQRFFVFVNLFIHTFDRCRFVWQFVTGISFKLIQRIMEEIKNLKNLQIRKIKEN